MTKVQRYKVGYYSDEWGMSSNTPCLVPADSGYAVKFEDYFKLEAELAALKGENESMKRDQWQPIETAPKDGTVIDLWHEEFGRFPGCSWGHPIHCCGEMGSLCDSDWHSLPEGWVDEYNEPQHLHDFTNWMPLPKPPAMAQGEKG